MTSIKTTLSAFVVASGLTVGALGLAAAPAGAEPPPPPAPTQGEIPPPWAPPKPAEFWQGHPVVWISGWGGRWGSWVNGAFIPLTSNPVTGGG